MILVPRSVRVYFATQATNLRMSFEGLSNHVREVLRHDPLGGHVFVFQTFLSEAATLFPWYEAAIEHFRTGVAAVGALERKAYDHLFYLMLREANRTAHDRMPSPWLLRTIVAPEFSDWLLAQAAAPPPVAGIEFTVDPIVFFTRFQYPGNHKCEYWPVGRREVLAALLLLAGPDRCPRDEAFVNMAKLGDLPAVRFLRSQSTRPEIYFQAMRNAAAAGAVSVVRQFADWGMTAVQAQQAVEDLVSGHEFSTELFELLLANGASADAKVESELWVKGKLIKQTQSLLHVAAWRGSEEGVRALLTAGVDPTFKDALGRTAADEDTTPAILKLLAVHGAASVGFTIGDALKFLAKGAARLPKEQQQQLTAELKRLGDSSPLRLALDDPDETMNRLARALFGIRLEPAQKKRKLVIEQTEVIESPLTIKGELLVTGHVLILGDVEAGEITVDETGSLAVAGNISSSTIYCGGHLHCGGTIKATLLTAFDGGNINASEVDIDLAILYAYCVLNADIAHGEHFQIEHGVAKDDPVYVAAEAAVPKSCLSAEADLGVHRIDFNKLRKAAQRGKLKPKKTS